MICELYIIIRLTNAGGSEYCFEHYLEIFWCIHRPKFTSMQRVIFSCAQRAQFSDIIKSQDINFNKLFINKSDSPKGTLFNWLLDMNPLHYLSASKAEDKKEASTDTESNFQSERKLKNQQFYRKEVIAKHLKSLPVMISFLKLIKDTIESSETPSVYSKIVSTIDFLLSA